MEPDISYPCAVTSGDDEGLLLGFRWCAERMEDGDTLTLFVPLKSSLRDNAVLTQLARYRGVEVVTSRGYTSTRTGPVLAAWPNMDDLGKVTRAGSRLRALCVAAWVEEQVRPWVAASGAEVLSDSDVWAARETPDLDDVVEEAMKSLTVVINHSNTIAAGYEKDHVVSALLALHDAGYRLDGATLQGWALAHGWRGKNPQHLADYAHRINDGKRPQARKILRDDYVERLREKAAQADDA